MNENDEGRNNMLCNHIKTGTYFVMHLTVSIIVAYAFTGSLVAAFGIGLTEPFIQTIFYHFHEKYWDKIHLERAQQ